MEGARGGGLLRSAAAGHGRESSVVITNVIPLQRHSHSYVGCCPSLLRTDPLYTADHQPPVDEEWPAAADLSPPRAPSIVLLLLPASPPPLSCDLSYHQRHSASPRPPSTPSPPTILSPVSATPSHSVLWHQSLLVDHSMPRRTDARHSSRSAIASVLRQIVLLSKSSRPIVTKPIQQTPLL